MIDYCPPAEFSVFVSPHLQDSITVLGQICCDSNGKLNAQSVLLEAGPEQGGQQVPVDLSELKEYSLFPGQVSRRGQQMGLLLKSFLLYLARLFRMILNCSSSFLLCIVSASNMLCDCIHCKGELSGGLSFACARRCVYQVI